MIEFSEHFYSDDPNIGHPDVRTDIKGVSYFFIGNGWIQGAVQFSPEGFGTPLGLLIMDPEILGMKRQALTIDDKTGLENTSLKVRIVGNDKENTLVPTSVNWTEYMNIPAVSVEYDSAELKICELYYCPTKDAARILRKISITNNKEEKIEIEAGTGVRDKTIGNRQILESGATVDLYISYTLDSATQTVIFGFTNKLEPDITVQNFWKSCSNLELDYPLLKRYFKASAEQLASMISNSGKIDASIWQYNREWVRDHSYMVIGLLQSGHHDSAKIMLERLLNEFVSDAGDTIDSSEIRTPDEVELDQNGILLYTVWTYYVWTGDKKFLEQNWQRIDVCAEFVFRDVFRHKESGLLYNCRDFWERHKAHGVETGIEFAHQMFVVIGLNKAAELADMLNMKEKAQKWQEFSDELRDIVLNDPVFSFLKDKGFIKRKGLDGKLQEKISPRKEAELPQQVPLAQEIDHYLNPDTSTAMAITFGFVDGETKVAKDTLESLEELWNQDWDIGGYGRYNYTSEADSSGPWPFTCIYIAKAYMETGRYDRVTRVLNWLNTVPGSISCSWFEFYGNRIAPPYAQTGITPWNWAEMIMLVVHHIAGIRPGLNGVYFKPQLIPGLNSINGSFPYRGKEIKISISREKNLDKPVFISGGDRIILEDNEIYVPFEDKIVILDAIFPVEDNVEG